MTVSHGMDTARARGIAAQLKIQGALLGGLGARGTMLSETLKDVWGGPDAEKFAREWQGARPVISRSSQELMAIADELTHEAEQQDRTSEAERGGSGSGADSRPTHVGGRVPDLGRPNLPVVPVLDPGAVGSTWRAITEAARGLWDTYTSPLFGLIEGAVTSVVDWVTDNLDLKKFKILGKAFKVLGAIGAVASIIFGQMDMVQAVRRFFTEGPSWDAALQFLEGWTGWASGGLAIAAVFAGGTLLGVPVAVVLGVGAAILGAASIGIGLAREYGPEFIEFVKEDPGWAAKVSQHGGLRHGWELPERQVPIGPVYRLRGVPIGA